MKLDFNEFLRIMSCILIILLVIQGLDYIVGFGINNYIFIVFCIVFAFTMGSIYHNILDERKKNKGRAIRERLDNIQNEIDEEYNRNGLTEAVSKAQFELDKLREELGFDDG